MNGAGLTWLASYPKSGNTWLRALLTTLADGGVRPRLSGLGARIPNAAALDWIEQWVDLPTDLLLYQEQRAMRVEAHRLAALAAPTPLWLKVHDRFDLALFAAEATDRIVYVIRDPRDVVLSWADHLDRSVEETVARMNQSDFTLSPIGSAYRVQAEQRFGSWSDHVGSWTTAPARPLLVLRYEDMLAEPLVAAHRLVAFLKLDCDAATVAAAVDACRFAALSAAEDEEGFNERRANQRRFFRKGRAGGWRETLDPVLVAAIEQAHGATMRRFGYVVESAPSGRNSSE